MNNNAVARSESSSNRLMESVFEEKYESNLWAGGLSDGTKSGFGSTMSNTEAVREYLPKIFKELRIKSFLDAPCGDFHWMRKTDISAIKYIGGDIAKSVIEQLQETDSTKNIEFRYFDIVESDYPNVDAWMCRDCLIHLPLELGVQALENFCRSKIKYAMLTHIENDEENKDIPIGRYSPRNMRKAPFNLPKPLHQVDDISFSNSKHFDRKLCVWSRQQIIKALK